MNMLAQNPPGASTQDAANSLKYYPVWQQERIDGKTNLQFEEWLRQFLRPAQPAPQQGAMSGNNILAGLAGPQPQPQLNPQMLLQMLGGGV